MWQDGSSSGYIGESIEVYADRYKPITTSCKNPKYEYEEIKYPHEEGEVPNWKQRRTTAFYGHHYQRDTIQIFHVYCEGGESYFGPFEYLGDHIAIFHKDWILAARRRASRPAERPS